MTPDDAAEILMDQIRPSFELEKARADGLDKWARWDHADPSTPHAQTSPEYKQLSDNAQTPWGMLVVSTVAQGLFVEGYRGAQDEANSPAWNLWQANKMDARQTGIHRAALSFGTAYSLVLPAIDQLTGEPTASIRGFSPRQMIALYEDVAVDDWPKVAARFRPTKTHWAVTVYDDEYAHEFHVGTSATDKPVLQETSLHGMGVVPVVRYDNITDLEGRSCGEIEPIIPLLGRLDQTKFDRLVVQRFASWVVRTISGIDLGESADKEKLRLRAEQVLVAKDPDTKFGSLPASPLDGFNESYGADLRDMSAVTQVAPHHLLGQIANLSAEALAAAEASQDRKIDERKHTLGEGHEQTLRLAGQAVGDTELARDYEAQVRWKDTQSRSLAQAADALGKMAQMLNVPVELLWEDIPGWTEQKVNRARKLVEQDGDLIRLFSEIAGGQTEARDTPELPAS